MAAEFEIRKGKNKQFYFVLKAANGEPILRSEGYVSKAGAKNGIASVRKNARMDARFERRTARNGKHFFNLKAGNGQVIGTSEMYNSQTGRNIGIRSVGTNAGKAKIQDLSKTSGTVFSKQSLPGDPTTPPPPPRKRKRRRGR